jgi:hypothetical protein
MQKCPELFTCQATLWNTNLDRNMNFFIDHKGDNRENFLGKTLLHGQILIDPLDLKKHIFFVYHDLAVRVPGFYRIQCSVMRFPQDHDFPIFVEQLITTSFEVHSQKT